MPLLLLLLLLVVVVVVVVLLLMQCQDYYVSYSQSLSDNLLLAQNRTK